MAACTQRAQHAGPKEELAAEHILHLLVRCLLFLGPQDVQLTTSDGVKLHAWLLSMPHWTAEYMRLRPVIMFFQASLGS